MRSYTRCEFEKPGGGAEGARYGAVARCQMVVSGGGINPGGVWPNAAVAQTAASSHEVNRIMLLLCFFVLPCAGARNERGRATGPSSMIPETAPSAYSTIERMKSLADRLRVEPGSKVKLSKFDANTAFGYHKNDSSRQVLQKNLRKLYELQALLYADRRFSLLIVLQALDAGGKDGTIRHVMAGVNPQGCEVVSFKAPSVEELEHDFLWRVHKAVPRRGNIGIFNRSHYEDVLITRVHNLIPKAVWSARYDQINAFEKILVDNNTRILKFFLHISKDEQKARFEERVQNPVKNWKISEADFLERKYWDDYTSAYEDALEKCSTSYAPWYIIPADKKWFRNLAVAQIIVETLDSMKLRYPAPTIDLTKVVLDGEPITSAAAD